MRLPDPKTSTGMLLEGVFSSEVVDSSGEIVKIDGMDISTLLEDKGVANYEHNGKEGGGKEVVGKIVYVKKIFKEKDCDTDSQKFFFEQVKRKPYLYGIVRLFDGAGHHEAQDLAAQIRDYIANDEPIIVGFSIEGSTMEREGHIILSCIARKVALTLTPANKACESKVIVDPNAPEGFKKLTENPLRRSLGGSEVCCNPIFGEEKENNIYKSIKILTKLSILSKAISAGGAGTSAPSNAVGGAALQKEMYKGTILATARDFDGKWDRKKFKNKLKENFQKAALPEVSDEYLDHFANIAEDWKIKKSEIDPIVSYFVEKTQELEYRLIDFKKSVQDILQGVIQNKGPRVYRLDVKTDQGLSPAGRWMVSNGQVVHLEDYHGHVNGLFPEGPVTPESQLRMWELTNSPFFVLSEHVVPNAPNGGPVTQGQVSFDEPVREPVFEYHRPGLMQPHIVEFGENGATLDGAPLEDDELELILANARKGLATLKWLQGVNLAKREAHENLFANSAHLKGLDDTDKKYSSHYYNDRMVKNVGNKHAWNEFSKQKKPGAYAVVDLHDMKSINKKHGKTVGDEGIKAFGKVLTKSAKAVGTVRVFRHGGDRFVVHAPTHEDLNLLLRHLHKDASTLPPIQGTHAHSFSVGVGHSHESAELALLKAKAKKTDIITGQPIYKPGQAPILGYSLYKGHEGHLFKDDPHSAGLKEPQNP